LRQCLESIHNQTITNQLEIIILDSMSTDKGRDIAEKFKTKIIEIPADSFDHGLTRNIGVKHAKGEFVYLTVQDAWIANTDMLEKMVSHFEDADVMAVAGHQAVPHEKDKNPFLWYRPYSTPGVTEKWIKDVDAFKALPLKEQQSLVSWDNVVCMYRKNALLKQPFVSTAFAEDWIWSYHALLKGWKLFHDSSLVVYHYHHNSYRYAFNSGYTINYHFYKFFKYKPILPSLAMPVIRATYHLLKNKTLSLHERFCWIMHNAAGRTGNFISTFNFLLRLKTGGERGIEKGYHKYCRSIPQGKQKA
jgi:rhamnosyltransferase